TPDGRELITAGDDMVLLAWPGTAAGLAKLPRPSRRDDSDLDPTLEPIDKSFDHWSGATPPPRCARHPKPGGTEGPLHGCASRRLGTSRWRLDGDIGVAAISPDEKLVAGAGDGDDVRVWSFPRGELVHRFDLSDDGGATGLAFLPDGRLIVAPLMGNVQLYEMGHGTMVDELPWGLGIEAQMHLSTDGRRLVLERFKSIAVHDFADPGASWKKPLPRYRGASISGDGRRLVVDTEQGPFLIDATTGERLRELDDMPAFALRVLPNGTLLGLGEGFEIMLGSPDTGMAPSGVNAHDEHPRALTIAADSRTALLVGESVVEVADLTNPDGKRAIPIDGDVESVTLSRDGALVMAGLSQELALFPSDGGPRLNPTDGHRTTPAWLSFDGHGRLWAAGYLDAARAWPLVDGARAGSAPGGGDIAISADGEWLFTRQDAEAPLRRRRLAGGSERTLAAAPACRDVRPSRDASVLSCTVYEDGVHLLDGRTGKSRRHGLAGEAVGPVRLSADGDALFAIQDQTLRRLVLRGRDRQIAHGFEDGVGRLHVDRDHVILEAGGTLQWRDGTTLDVKGTLERNEPLRDVAISPDGEWVAITTYSNTLELWETATKQERARITLHDAAPNAVAWSPDGETIATSHVDTTILLWNRDTLLGR
ncbi:MAG: WD40 repeat domain-containing protein, partial [Polyangiaceae bacterium]